MEDKKPKRIKFDKRELPPYETKGRETPTIGISPIFIPTFVRNSVERRKKEHTANILRNMSSESFEITIILYKRNEKVKTIINPPTKPNSSDRVAKIKSVCLSGKNLKRDWVPCPRPFPKNIPDPTAIID